MVQQRGEAVLVSVRALFHSPDVTKQLDVLDDDVLKLQYGGPDDGNLTQAEVTRMEKDIDLQMRSLAVAMRRETESTK